jgi:hypothetical protein
MGFQFINVAADVVALTEQCRDVLGRCRDVLDDE